MPDKTSKPDNVNAAVPARGADAVLAEHTAAIKALGKRAFGDIVEIGHRLTKCKIICGFGNWLPWLDREFGWSEDTAERFIQVAALSDQIPQIAEFNLPLSGLYLLAAPSTPEPVRDEIIARAEAGEKLPVAEVKRVISAARGQQQPRSCQQPAKSHAQSINTGAALAAFATEEESLSALILHEWRTAERAFESLTRHSVTQIATAIPAESRNATANLATEFANLFTDLAVQLRQSRISPSRGETRASGAPQQAP